MSRISSFNNAQVFKSTTPCISRQLQPSRNTGERCLQSIWAASPSLNIRIARRPHSVSGSAITSSVPCRDLSADFPADCCGQKSVMSVNYQRRRPLPAEQRPSTVDAKSPRVGDNKSAHWRQLGVFTSDASRSRSVHRRNGTTLDLRYFATRGERRPCVPRLLMCHTS